MKSVVYLLIGLLLLSCDEIPQTDLSGVVIERRDRFVQKVTKGEILKKAVAVGRKSINDSTPLITTVNDDMMPVEKEIIEMYFEASKENYKEYNVQFFDNDKWILYNEPYYDKDLFIGVYSIKLESSEVIKSMHKDKKSSLFHDSN